MANLDTSSLGSLGSISTATSTAVSSKESTITLPSLPSNVRKSTGISTMSLWDAKPTSDAPSTTKLPSSSGAELMPVHAEYAVGIADESCSSINDHTVDGRRKRRKKKGAYGDHRAILDEASKVSKEVGKTVEQLQNIRVDGLNGGAYGEIKDVTDVLQQLEKTCQDLRVSLESETIIWSNYRHDKLMFPVRMTNEVKKILGSLSRDNTQQLNKVKARVVDVESRVKEKEAELERIQSEVQRMKPEVKNAQKGHEENVQDLNRIMGEKARCRIVLNEKMAEDAIIVEQTQELEEQIQRLRDELEVERLAAEKEIDEIGLKVAERKEHIANKEDQCFALRREICVTQDEAELVGAEVTRLKDELSTLKVGCNLCKARKTAAKEEYDETARSVLKKQAKGRDIKAAQVEETAAHEERIRQLKLREEEALENTRYAQEEMEKLKPQFARAQKIHQRSSKRADAESGRLASIQTTVDTSRNTLMAATDECSNCIQELEQLAVKEKQMEQGLEAHKAFAAEVRQDAENRLRQKKERKIKLLMERDEVMEKKRIQENQVETQEVECDAKLVAKETKCEELETEVVTTKERIKSGGAAIVNLRQTYQTLKAQFTETKATLERRRDELKVEVDQLEAHDSTNAGLLADLKPVVDKLKADFELLSQGCDEKKKLVMELKNKKAGLLDKIGRVDRELEKSHLPQERLLNEIQMERSAGAHQLRDQALETEDKEHLKSVREENARFEEAIKTMDDECERTRRRREESQTVKQELQQSLATLQGSLASGWSRTKAMEQDYASGDWRVLQNIDELMEKLHKRHSSIKQIETQLELELKQLGRVKESVHL
ncbi:myosin-9-like [Sycon ciliatum]|uniref:myosin-9-like n=1 Tax=Sycon ciliatum TaxID=27933 RepID=UPI0031F6D6AE